VSVAGFRSARALAGAVLVLCVAAAGPSSAQDPPPAPAPPSPPAPPAPVEGETDLRSRLEALERRVTAQDEEIERLRATIKRHAETGGTGWFASRVAEVRRIREELEKTRERLEATEKRARPSRGAGAVERRRKRYRRALEIFEEGREAMLEKPAPFVETLNFGVNFTGTTQAIVNNDLGRDAWTGVGSIDLVALAELHPNILGFIDLEAIGGDGPDEFIGSLSGLNGDVRSGSTQDSDGVDRIQVLEAWIELPFAIGLDALRITAGKLDLTNHFDLNAVANDETSQFLTDALVTNPTFSALLPGANGPAARVSYTLAQAGWTFSIAAASADDSASNLFDDLVGVLEIEKYLLFFDEYEGSIRLLGTIDGANEADRNNLGLGVSFDQELPLGITIFARLGVNEERSRGPRFTWSVGFEVALGALGEARPDDVLGVAFSQVDPDRRGLTTEEVFEVYYRIQVHPLLAVSPILQVVLDPAGERRADPIVLFGARLNAGF